MIHVPTAAEVAREQLCSDLCKVVGAAVSTAYPGHQWDIECNDPTAVRIICTAVHGKQGMFLHTVSRNGMPKTTDELQRQAVRLAGENLERFNVARTRRGPAQAWEIARQRRLHPAMDNERIAS